MTYSLRGSSSAGRSGDTMRTWIILLTLAASLASREAVAQVQLGGYVLTDWRAWLQDGKLFWNENRVNLEVDASPTSNVHVFTQIWVRGRGFAAAETTSDLMGFDKRRSDPWDLALREAYVDLYGFLTPDLDVRVGRQRIAWGTADNINPTDNVNPDALEDIWDFGRHLGTNAVLATYYLGDVTLSGVFAPGFIPATLPAAPWASALGGPVALPDDLRPSKVSDELVLPDSSLSESATVALKVAKRILNHDLSLSYYTGLSGFPVPTQVVLVADDMGGVEVQSTLGFPRLSVFGADLSGAIGDVGVWAEVGVFFPEAVHATLDMSAVGGVLQEIVPLRDESFVRYVVGGDYTFRNGLYVNGQFVHGFVHELGRDALHDYLVAGVEKKFHSDRIKVTVAGAAEVPGITDVDGNWALIGMPEIAFYPWDNSEITVGVRLLDANGQTNFGQLAQMDEAYLAIRYAF